MKHLRTPKRQQKATAPLRGPTLARGLGNDPGDRFAEYFRELPGIVREVRVQIANAPSELRHLVDTIDDAMNELSLDAGRDAIEAASIHIRASIASAASILIEPSLFAGQLAQVAREAEVMASADERRW